MGDRWEPISWDEAFTEVVDRVQKVQEEHGRDAVGVYLGNPNAHNFGTLVFGPPFLRSLGSKNRFSATSCDQLPLMLASYFMFGHQLLFPVPDVDRTDFMMLIGANPLASNGSIMAAPGHQEAPRGHRKRGGKVVVVDPRRCETARAADEHVFIQPGTDALFLLGLLHEVCAAGIDLGRISDSVKNADRVLELAKAYPPEQSEAVTGVSAETVKRLARELRAAPKAVLYGRVGACTQEFGGLCMWLINVLNAVTGNLDEPGGSMFSSPAIDVRRNGGRIRRGPRLVWPLEEPRPWAPGVRRRASGRGHGRGDANRGRGPGSRDDHDRGESRVVDPERQSARPGLCLA